MQDDHAQNDKTITQTTCVKYLGVFIDDKLTWSNHIAFLENKLSRSVGLFLSNTSVSK